jgi:FMN phosphatase YigB (HAD superfamily)
MSSVSGRGERERSAQDPPQHADNTGASRRLYTFDVFDTAITRPVHVPDHLHWSVGRRLAAAGLLRIGEDAWRNARVTAERVGRERHTHGEVTLSDIYAELVRAGVLQQHDSARALQIEWEEELRVVRPVASVNKRISHLQSGGDRLSLVSDTYFSRGQVHALLEAAGYVLEPETIYASCEHGSSKAHGSLFEVVAQASGVRCASIVHSGDNPGADVAMAGMSGCAAIPFTESHPTDRERFVYASGPASFLTSAIAGSSRAARLEIGESRFPGLVTAGTSVSGPLFTAYVLWLMLDVIKRGGDTIYFLARDGQILQAICRRLADWMGVRIDARYLLVSRRALLLPALPADPDAAIKEALQMSRDYDLDSALRSIGLGDDERASILQTAGGKPGLALAAYSADQLQAVVASLSDAGHGATLAKRAARAREAALAYLGEEGFLGRNPAFIADLGWKGNMQRRLTRIVGDRGSLFGYYMALEGSDLAASCWTDGQWGVKPSLLEIFAAADHASVAGIRLGADGRPEPFPAIGDDAEAIAWGAKVQQQAVLAFVDNLLRAVDRRHFAIEEVAAALRSSGFAAYSHICTTPTVAEAEAYGGIVHASNPTHSNGQPIAARLGNVDAIRMLVSSAARRQHSEWYFGSLARSQDKLFPRIISGALQRYGRLRTRVMGRLKRV